MLNDYFPGKPFDCYFLGFVEYIRIKHDKSIREKTTQEQNMFELAQDQDENLPLFEKLPFTFIFFSLFFTCLLPFSPTV